MKKLRSSYQAAIFKLRLAQGLTYRTAAAAGVATQFFWGMILIMMFTAFYGNQTSVDGFTKSQLTTYIWLQQAFLVFIALWIRDLELFELIRTGNIAYELCRPINLYSFWYTKLLSSRFASAALRCLPILVFAYFFPKPYGLELPDSLTALLLFIVALVLGVMINVAISMFIYISVFITLSPIGSLLIFSVVGEFFSGMVIPIPLMPDALQKVLMCLPFRYTGYLPFRIYSGNVGITDAVIGIGIQIFWLLFLPLLGNFLLNKALKHLVVQGG
jgi:ABC-2 type transport system permease protein